MVVTIEAVLTDTLKDNHSADAMQMKALFSKYRVKEDSDISISDETYGSVMFYMYLAYAEGNRSYDYVISENASGFIEALAKLGVRAYEKNEVKIEMVDSNDIEKMDRNSLIPVVDDIHKITTWLDEVIYKGIAESENRIIDLGNRYAKIRDEFPSWTYKVSILFGAIIGILTWIGDTFISGLIIGAILAAILFGILYLAYYLGYYKSKMQQDYERKMNNIELLENQIVASYGVWLDLLKANENVEWAINIVGEEMMFPEYIDELRKILKGRRADNLKEALNKFDEVQHVNKMEEMQKAVQNAAEVAAEESVKQTMYAQQIEKNTHEAATAAKATAYHTRRVAHNTKVIKNDLKRRR